MPKAAAPEIPSEPTEPQQSEPRVEREAAAGPARALAGTWTELARSGRYGEAVDAAETAGFDGICATASAADLVLLADAARFGGRLPRAVVALETLRRRFAGTPAATQAAFTLGRIAFDRRHAYADAARWFAIYMREAP
jgi:hypothetical protein